MLQIRALIAVLLAACAGPASTQSLLTIRFAIEAVAIGDAPLYVLVNDADDQPGWLTITGPSGRVYLRERCDIPDCGAPPAACGAAIPVVRNIAAGSDMRRIELVWDGTTSELDSATHCERRRPAEPGNYLARFCYARQAELPPGVAGPAAPGRLVRPVCTERGFTLRDTSVVLTL